MNTEPCLANNKLNCACVCIENVNCIKYLGLYIDSRLKWKNQIEHLISLSRKLYYIFRNLRSILDKMQLRIVYISLVQSVITYGIESWGCAYDTHLIKLKTTMNK